MSFSTVSIANRSFASPPSSFGFAPAGVRADALSAAREFEALLIARLLKTAREAGQALSQTAGTTGAEGYLELAEEHVARVLAQRGAFGISRLVLEGLQNGPPENDIRLRQSRFHAICR